MSTQPLYQDSLSLGDVLLGMLRRFSIILACLALGILLGYLINSYFKPRYETEAHVLVEKRELVSQFDKTSNNQGRITAADDRDVAAQANVIMAADTVKRVVSKLNLTERKEFAQARPGQLSRFLTSWGFTDDVSRLPPEERVRKDVTDKLSVYQLPGTSIIGIKYTSSNPQLAAEIANAFGEVAILSSEELQEGSAGRNRQFLANQVEIYRERVTEAEAKSEAYRAANGLTEGEKAVVNTEKITDLSTQITQAETAKSEADARLREIKRVMASPGGIEATSEVLNSPTIQGLAAKLTEAKSRQSELSATYLDRHPRIIAVKTDIRDLERQIRREMQKIARSLEGQAKIADSRLQTLTKNLSDLESKAGELGQKDVKLRELERDAAASRKQLEDMLARLAEANASQTSIASTQSSMRFIERAEVPTSVTFPRKGPIYLLTGLSGLAVGLGLAFLLALLGAAKTANARQPYPAGRQFMPPVEARGSEQAPVMFDIPAHPPPAKRAQANKEVGSINIPDFGVPTAAAASPAPSSVFGGPVPQPASLPQHVQPAPQPPASAAPGEMDVVTYIFSTIESEIASGQHARISFTRIGGDVLDGAGASMATARALAAKGKKVLVIDADRLGRSIEAILAIGEAPGLSDAVSGRDVFTRIVSRDPDSRVHVIRYGTVSEPQIMDMIGQRMPAILQSLSSIYDVIILNGGVAGPDVLGMLRSFPVAFLLSPKAHRQDVTLAADTLIDQGVASVHYIEVGHGAEQAAA
jgi:polysaccharide biosynthesis transport protein